MQVKRFVAVLGLAMLTWAASTVQAEGPEAAPVATGSVVLINQGDQSLKFALRPADGKWVVYSIDSGKSATLACDHCKAPYFEFSMVTDKSQVSYRLTPDESYLLYWNQDKHRWDLSHLESAR